MLAAPAREILYTAVLISGIESLLGETVRPPYTSRDVIRSVVRDALRRLEQQDEERACELRNFWGGAMMMNPVRVFRRSSARCATPSSTCVPSASRSLQSQYA
jgi:hypothetical protein